MVRCWSPARSAWIVLTLWLAVAAPAGAADEPSGTPYHSPAGQYSIHLPAGWVPAPEDQEALLRQWRSRQPFGGRADLAFDADFECRDANGVAAARIVVAVCRYATNGLSHQPSDAEMRKMVSVLTGITDVHVRDANTPADANAQPADAPTLDPQRKAFRWTFQAGPPGGPQARSWVVGHFGRQALVQIMCTCPAEEWARHEASFRQVEESFRFDAGAEYLPAAVRAPWRDKVKQVCFAGAVVAALFVLQRARRRAAAIRKTDSAGDRE